MTKRLIIFFILILVTTDTYAWKIEADKIVIDNTTGNVTTHITFRQAFDVTPLVFTLMDDKGSDPSALRVTNVSTTGFDIYTVEPDGEDGPHTNMTSIPYIAIEPGEHTFPDGSKTVASTVQTHSFQSKLIAGDSWRHVGLSGFSTTPIVLGEIQTRVNERTDDTVPDAVSQPWITTAVSNVGSGGFDVALERSETNSGTLGSDETIAYLVMESGLNGGDHYFGSSSGDKIEYETIRSDDIIRGWDNGDYTINFSKTYDDPMVVATKNTRDGVDGGWLRRGTIADDHITLQVDEDKANDSDRGHTTERAGLLLFSEPFDAEFLNDPNTRMVINEVMYAQTVSGTDNDEFVELYVTHGGDIKGFVLSDQDSHYYRFPSCSVNRGDYVIHHTGGNSVNNSCSGSVKHFYQGSNPYWNNGSSSSDNDDVLLILPDQDVTSTTHATASTRKTFNGRPIDYMAYGKNGTSGNIDAIPTSMKGNDVSYNYSKGSELKGADTGQSISLTPNGNDSDKSACWELTTSGNASDNGCSDYLPTRDTEPDGSLTYSMGENNNAMPDMHISKTSIVISDPVNTTSNPKRIPGAIVRYCFAVDNTGGGDADNATIHDSLTGDGKDNLDYQESGYTIQNITVACDCAALTNASSGSISGTDVTINLGTITGTNDTTHSRGCAYIETEIK